MTPTIAEIQQAVCAEFGISVIAMKSDCRRREIARPRQVAMYLCRLLTPRSLPDIAWYFGERHHTTALHASRTVPALLAIDQDLAHSVLRVMDALRNPNQMLLPLAAE